MVPIAGKVRNVLAVVLGLIVVGVALWAVNTYIPMASAIKALLNIVVFVATCVLVLQALGLWEPLVTMVNNVRRRHPSRRIVHHEEPSATRNEKRETKNEPVTTN